MNGVIGYALHSIYYVYLIASNCFLILLMYKSYNPSKF